MLSFGRESQFRCVVLFVTVVTFVATIKAFTIPSTNQNCAPKRAVTNNLQFYTPLISSTTKCSSSANTNEGTEQEATQAEGASSMDETVIVDETTIANDVITEITSSGGDVQEEQNVEDPAVTQVKEEIAKLEQDAKNARRQLANINDEADDFSKTGYARKVAEMENMRRARSVCT
jgi:hypothetical protein